jgi:hypothetical protein
MLPQVVEAATREKGRRKNRVAESLLLSCSSCLRAVGRHAHLACLLLAAVLVLLACCWSPCSCCLFAVGCHARLAYSLLDEMPERVTSGGVWSKELKFNQHGSTFVLFNKKFLILN